MDLLQKSSKKYLFMKKSMSPNKIMYKENYCTVFSNSFKTFYGRRQKNIFDILKVPYEEIFTILVVLD